jgi:hypothetical protein
LFRKADRPRQPPADPERAAAIRRSIKWLAFSYVTLGAAAGWALFAFRHWPGSRGGLLAASGAMVCLAADSALISRFLLELTPHRQILGMTLGRYTVVSIFVALAIAALTGVIGIAVLQ